MPTKKKTASRVVSAVGMASNGAQGLGPRIEAAMAQAVTDAYAEGISDPKEHAKRIQAARKAVVAEAREADNRASAEETARLEAGKGR